MTKGKPLVGFTLQGLRQVRITDIAVRFCFGAVVSALAATLSITLGSRPGGLFLAFPAILPATLTLIEKEESEKHAEDEDVGAVLGAAALIPFALLVWQLLPGDSAALVLGGASFAWLAAAVLLYFGFRYGVQGKRRSSLSMRISPPAGGDSTHAVRHTHGPS